MISNFTFMNGEYGIYVDSADHVQVRDNNVINCAIGGGYWVAGIAVYSSRNVVISDNLVLGQKPYNAATSGIFLTENSDNCLVDSNNVSYFDSGIYLFSYSDSNIISNNIVSYNHHNNLAGGYAFNNTYFGNTEYGASLYGICFQGYDQYIGNNRFYHNNLARALSGWQILPGNGNIWDNGYPSGGNYWSDYQTRYSNATEIDGSDIWNTSYVIDANNTDRYPLMKPWTGHDVAITSVAPSKTVITEGDSMV